jgi:Fic family protein
MKLPKKGPSLMRLLADPKKTVEVLNRAAEPAVRALVERANNEVWNWEDCRYRSEIAGLSPREIWTLVKLSRASGRQTISLTDSQGSGFSYRLPPSSERLLHLVDRNLGGMVQSAFPQLESDPDRQRYLLTSLIEEAIASSQLEGAAVTREVAQTMLRTGRPPRSPDERMILNNYQTIRMLNSRKGEALTPAFLIEIQKQLTEGAIDKADASGRFRRPEENVRVWDDEDQQVLHVPPPAAEIPARVEALCRFANEKDGMEDTSRFVHPAVRAMLLHFWLAYDHPFVDGNGRTARALFYWSMLRSGYWLVEYLTISSIIRQQPKQYARAFLNTERDENDLTYFLLYHLGVIERSVGALREYLERKMREKRQLARVVLPALFNPRQQAILIKAIKEPETVFTYESHARSHGVTLATARSDLLALEGRGLLRGNRVGRRFEFLATLDLEERLRKLGSEPTGQPARE